MLILLIIFSCPSLHSVGFRGVMTPFTPLILNTPLVGLILNINISKIKTTLAIITTLNSFKVYLQFSSLDKFSSFNFFSRYSNALRGGEEESGGRHKEHNR